MVATAFKKKLRGRVLPSAIPGRNSSQCDCRETQILLCCYRQDITFLEFFPPLPFSMGGQGCILLSHPPHGRCDFLCLQLPRGPPWQLGSVGWGLAPPPLAQALPGLRHPESCGCQTGLLALLCFALLRINKDPVLWAGCPERQAGLGKETEAFSVTLPKGKEKMFSLLWSK